LVKSSDFVQEGQNATVGEFCREQVNCLAYV